jgi:co-chaperonin GroES (HSP10)
METTTKAVALPPSLYLPYFEANRDWLKDHVTLVGDILLVERIRFPEKKIGSIILADRTANQVNTLLSNQPTFYRVLHVGNGYYDDETKQDEPLEVQPGHVVLTGSVSANIFSYFPMLEVTDSDVLGVTRYSDVQAHIKSEEAFVQFLGALNSSVKAEVEKRKQG